MTSPQTENPLAPGDSFASISLLAEVPMITTSVQTAVVTVEVYKKSFPTPEADEVI